MRYLILFLLLLPFVSAESISVSPPTINLEDQETLFLINVNDKDVQYRINDDLPEWIEISSRNGTIKKGERELLLLSLSPYNIETGHYEFKLNIIFSNENSLALVSGVNVDIIVDIPKDRFGLIKGRKNGLIALAVVVGLAGIAVVVMR